MFTIPTDRIYKFLAITSLIVCALFIIFPDIYAYYSQKQIISIEIKRAELSQEMTMDDIALENARKLAKSQRRAERNLGVKIADSVQNNALKRTPKIASLNQLCLLQEKIEKRYLYWIEIRTNIIVTSLIVFGLCVVAWIIMDVIELKKNGD